MNNKKKTIRTVMARTIGIGLLVLLPMGAVAQRLLTLDSCRAMALRNNKQMGMAKIKQEVNANLQRSARTQYLPKVNALGGYMWTSREISILDDDKKDALNHLGSNMNMQENLAPLASALPAALQEKVSNGMAHITGVLDQTGAGIVNGLRTDTRNMFAGAVMVTQPLFMGGAITAANNIADINVEMAANSLEMKRQDIVYHIDQTYWQVVSLRHKQKLAESFVTLVKKLESDVQKMINQGVATKGDGLSVSVRVNEAEMALTQVTDGLALSKMLLCQLCGMPVEEAITLADEETEDVIINHGSSATADPSFAFQNRPELMMLRNAIDLTTETTHLLKAGNLPQVLLTGGFFVSNPNTFNGFEKKFGGVWNVGVVVRVPVWNWGDVKYKVRASKGATAMANMEYDEARELIELQVHQSNFKVNEAYKKLEMANANVANAEENLRMANLGFKEGTVTFTTVMEAQTAWQLAQTQKIDSEIGVKLAQVEMQKVLGTIQ